MADNQTGSFSKDEREAMKERAREAKLEVKRAKGENLKAQDLADVLSKIAAMSPADRVIAEKIHALVKAHAPQLNAKTWYGMPAYGLDGKTVCFFQSGEKFKTRYCTLGFSDNAKLDSGALWATSFAIERITPEVETQIAALLAKAVSG
jgi:uncharacterized protein YdhG (YjbR/CyaY superfamily)